jgi:hypothetical protein
MDNGIAFGTIQSSRFEKTEVSVPGVRTTLFMTMKQPTLFEILKTSLYVGAVGYGGPAILALMKKVIVREEGWISDEEFMSALSLSQILPGNIGVSLLVFP